MSAIDERLAAARTAERLNAHESECTRRYQEIRDLIDGNHLENRAAINRVHERIDRSQLWLIGILGTAVLTLAMTLIQFALARH